MFQRVCSVITSYNIHYTKLYDFHADEEDAEALSSFLLQHYGEGAYHPRELLLPMEIPGRAALASLLSERAGFRLKITVPTQGERSRIVDLAGKNAAEAHRMEREREASYERVAARLGSLV